MLARIPRLRRCAYLITGSRRTADRAVAAALAAALAPGTALSEAALFQRVWMVVRLQPREGEVDDCMRGHWLFNLPLRDRALLVLVAVERMPVRRAAPMVGLDQRQAAAVVAGAMGAYAAA